jgi:hypothetical protein
MSISFRPHFLPGFPLLDLPAQGGDDFEPRSFQRVVASLRMDVRSGHSQQRKHAKGRGVVPLIFQNDSGGGYGREALQPSERLLQPKARTGADVKTTNVELDFTSLLGNGREK